MNYVYLILQIKITYKSFEEKTFSFLKDFKIELTFKKLLNYIRQYNNFVVTAKILLVE